MGKRFRKGDDVSFLLEGNPTLSGANAMITGDMLTTSGNNTTQDREMLAGIGFDLSRPQGMVV